MPRNDLKAYTSVIARLPQALADQVKQYASQHRCSVSELIREGLEMRLEAEVPGRSTGTRHDAGEEVLHEVLQAVKVLTPMGQAGIRQILTEVLHEVLPHYVSSQTPLMSGHTEVVPLETYAAPQDVHGITEVLPLETAPPVHEGSGITEVLHTPDAPVPATGSEASAGFDTQRYYLGKLCQRGHDYHGAGQSLRYAPSAQRGGCVACDAAKARERRARTKAARQEGEAHG